MLQFPGLFYLSGPEPVPVYLHRVANAMFWASPWLSFIVSPGCAIGAIVIGRRLLEHRLLTDDAFNLIKFLSAVSLVPMVVVALLFVGTIFGVSDQEDTDPIGRITSHLGNLTSYAYQYRIRPRSMNGGEGSYEGYTIPPGAHADSTSFGRRYRYWVVASTVEMIVFEVRCSGDVNGSVRATVDREGKVIRWKFDGDFEGYEFPDR